jgi:hypothetical protein
MTSCKEEDTCLYTEETITFYIEIATNIENGKQDVPIRKWNSDLKICILGNPRPKDVEEIADIINELNVLQNQISLTLTDTESNFNLSILVGDTTLLKEKWDWLGGNGQFNYNFNSSYEIVTGQAWLNSKLEDQEYRNAIIRHELTQVLGLPNDINSSSEFSTSIFNEKWINTEYSELDKLVIQMHYSDAIEHGMTSEVIRNLTCWR